MSEEQEQLPYENLHPPGHWTQVHFASGLMANGPRRMSCAAGRWLMAAGRWPGGRCAQKSTSPTVIHTIMLFRLVRILVLAGLDACKIVFKWIV